jgi:hypothetical protein
MDVSLVLLFEHPTHIHGHMPGAKPGLAAAPVGPIPAFQHHDAAGIKAQPDHVAPAPDLLRSLYDGRLAPRPGQ